MSKEMIRCLLNDKSVRNINIDDFNNENKSEDFFYKEILESFQNKIQSILVFKYEEDMQILGKEIKKLPYWIREYLNFEEEKCVNFYFLLRDNKKFLIVGDPDSLEGMHNECYFERLLKDHKIKDKLKKYEFRLSELLK